MRFLLAAEESAGARALTALKQSAHEVVAVMTHSKGGVRELAESLGCAVWSPKLVKDPATAARMRDARVDVLLNVYSMYQVCPEVLAAARVASFNLHPGLLPQVAGRNPVSAALYEGHTSSGVTLHFMTADFDAGAIAYQESVPIEDRDTALSLSAKCVRAGEGLVVQLLRDAAAGIDAVPRLPQDLSKRAYYPPEMPEGGRLDFDRPARKVVDFVRAYDFLPFASRWGHPKVGAIEIAKAKRTGRSCDAPPGTVGDAEREAVDVAAADEWVRVERVRVDGAYASAAAVLKGGTRIGGATP